MTIVNSAIDEEGLKKTTTTVTSHSKPLKCVSSFRLIRSRISEASVYDKSTFHQLLRLKVKRKNSGKVNVTIANRIVTTTACKEKKVQCEEMNRRDLLEYIRRRVSYGDSEIADGHRGHGVEKPVSKARKRQITCHELSPVTSSFEDNVIRKAESIRSSPSYKKSCRGLEGYEDDDIGNKTMVLSSRNTSKNVVQIEKKDYRKKSKFIGNGYLPSGDRSSGSLKHASFSTLNMHLFQKTPIAKEKHGAMKSIGGANGFLPNDRSNSVHSMHKYIAGEKQLLKGLSQKLKSNCDFPPPPQTAATENSDYNESMIPPHMKMNVTVRGNSHSGDEINAQIKQSFQTLDDLESNIDKAARYLQASFSSRVSLSGAFERGETAAHASSSSEDCRAPKHLPDSQARLKQQNVIGLTHGKTLGYRLKGQIAYGRNIIEMGEHLRDVRDAFCSSEQLLSENQVSSDKKLFLDERSFDRQSSFYATVQQRMNEALQRSSLPDNNDMHNPEPTQNPLKERNRDVFYLSTSSFSKMDSFRAECIANEEGQSLGSGTQKEEEMVEQLSSPSIRPLDVDESLPNYSSSQGVIHADGKSSLTFAADELSNRKHHAANTVKALRQFFKDSMLYFAELRKLYCRKKLKNLWKIKNEQERIKTACLLLKRKYIGSIHNAMPTKNFVDYHLHETARIQLLNLDVQKQLALLKGDGKGNLNIEKFRRASEKVLHVTKDFEKNNLASRLERWEQLLQSRSRGNKSTANFIASSDSARFSRDGAVRVVHTVQEIQVRNSRNDKRLHHLRNELILKRKEADFLKRTFEQRMMRNDQCEETSLKAQIAAHERYIEETEKDIAQLISLENLSVNLRKTSDVGSKNMGAAATAISASETPSSELSSFTTLVTAAGLEGTLTDGRFLDAAAESTAASCTSELHSAGGTSSSERVPGIKELRDVQSPDTVHEKEFGISRDTDDMSVAVDISYTVGKLSPNSSGTMSASSNILTLSKLSSLESSPRLEHLPHSGQDQITPSSRPVQTVEPNESAKVNGNSPISSPRDSTALAEALQQLTIHSPDSSNISNEIIYDETGSFKQDTSKEAILITLPSNSPKDEGESGPEARKPATPIVREKVSPIKENEITMDRRNSLASIADEQFFTPLTSDVEADNDEDSENREGEEETMISQIESSLSFHTTISSPVQQRQDAEEEGNNIDAALQQLSSPMLSSSSLSTKSRKFKLTLSPLASPRNAVSSRFASSMPPPPLQENTAESISNSPRTPKNLSSRCISPLAASLLETMLEDSLKTMLILDDKGDIEASPLAEAFMLDKKIDDIGTDKTLSPKAVTSSATNDSLQGDESFDLDKIPVPQDLIPGLDLSDVEKEESEINDENILPLKHPEAATNDETVQKEKTAEESRYIKLSEPEPLSQSRPFLNDKTWITTQIRSISEQLWNLACTNQPFAIAVNDDRTQEVQMRQMLADRCCEIVKQSFEDVGGGSKHFLGLTNINFFRPRNRSQLESFLHKQISKYYQTDEKNSKEIKRWEAVSRGSNSVVENIVLEELYAEQSNWEDLLENYENEIKSELITELLDEQLNESLEAVTRS